MIVQFHMSHETRLMNTAQVSEHEFYASGGNVVNSEREDFLAVHDHVPENLHFGEHPDPDVHIGGPDPDIHLLNNRRKEPMDPPIWNVYTTEHTLADTPPAFDNWLLIRGGVDTELFDGWGGPDPGGDVITATNNIANRPRAADQAVHEALSAASFDYTAYGRYNPGGLLSHAELAGAMREAAVYANVATTIPPNALYEALATGLPIVTVPGYGARDAVTHGYNGYVATSPEAFVTRVEQLLDEPETARAFGNRSRELAVGRYSQAEFVWRWRAVINWAGAT